MAERIARRLLVVVPTSLPQVASGLVSGLHAHITRHGLDWSPEVYDQDDILRLINLGWINLSEVVGLVGMFGGELWAAAAAAGCPGVASNNRQPSPDQRLAVIRTDDADIGELAARFALEHGYRRLVLFGSRGKETRDRRLDAAAAAAERLGLQHQRVNPHELGTTPAEVDPAIADALRAAGPGSLVFCFVDGEAAWLADLCRYYGLSVPEDVAVLGCHDHPAYHHRGALALSSISLPWHHIGSIAGLEMQRLNCGQAASSEQIRVRPVRVMERATTRRYAASEPTIQALVALVDRDLGRSWTAADLAAEIGISRRSLFRCAARAGLEPMAIVRDRRLTAASERLIEEDASVASIARRVGFASEAGFSNAFKRRSGMTPGAFRGLYRI